MSFVIESNKKGYTISFQTRGLSTGEVTLIWERLNPLDIKSLVAKTGHNLCVWGDGLVAELRCGKGNNIVVRCGKEQD